MPNIHWSVKAVVVLFAMIGLTTVVLQGLTWGLSAWQYVEQNVGWREPVPAGPGPSSGIGALVARERECAALKDARPSEQKPPNSAVSASEHRLSAPWPQSPTPVPTCPLDMFSDLPEGAAPPTPFPGPDPDSRRLNVGYHIKPGPCGGICSVNVGPSVSAAQGK